MRRSPVRFWQEAREEPRVAADSAGMRGFLLVPAEAPHTVRAPPMAHSGITAAAGHEPAASAAVAAGPAQVFRTRGPCPGLLIGSKLKQN